MNLIENVKIGVSAAVETLSDAAQGLIEKNRVNAQINRLKLVIKNENSILDKAYIQLGKYYFENSEAPDAKSVENLFEIVSNSKARLKMAQDIYRSILEKKTSETVSKADTSADNFVDSITVACSNEESYDGGSAEPENAVEGSDGVTVESAEDINAEKETETEYESVQPEEAADDGEEAF